MVKVQLPQLRLGPIESSPITTRPGLPPYGLESSSRLWINLLVAPHGFIRECKTMVLDLAERPVLKQSKIVKVRGLRLNKD